MTERSEQQKAADKFREGLREAIHRLPRGVVVEISTAAPLASGNDPFGRRSLTAAGSGYEPDVEMIAAHIGTDGHGWADLRVGVREARALLFINVDEVELWGVLLDETQAEWLGMMDDVRRWARGVRLHEVERVAQESWAKQVEAEAAWLRLPLSETKVFRGRERADREALTPTLPGKPYEPLGVMQQMTSGCPPKPLIIHGVEVVQSEHVPDGFIVMTAKRQPEDPS